MSAPAEDRPVITLTDEQCARIAALLSTVRPKAATS